MAVRSLRQRHPPKTRRAEKVAKGGQFRCSVSWPYLKFGSAQISVLVMPPYLSASLNQAAQRKFMRSLDRRWKYCNVVVYRFYPYDALLVSVFLIAVHSGLL